MTVILPLINSTHTHKHIYTHTYIYTHIYIYIHIHTHTHTYIYTHTQTHIYTNQINYFQEIKNIIIPNFQKERQVLKNKLIVENNLEEKLIIIDKIKEMKEKLKSIKFLEKNYLLKNMNHLEIYYI